MSFPRARRASRESRVLDPRFRARDARALPEQARVGDDNSIHLCHVH